MGHQGSLENKIKAIEHLDKEVVKVVKEELEKAGEDFRILIGPDHPTPIAIRTHSKEPIPFMIYDSTKDYEGQEEYSEEAARETGIVISHAYDLMNRLLQNKRNNFRRHKMLVVKKFGGTSVGNKDRIMNVAKRCIEDYKKGNDVVVVLSAMGKMTDELIAKAKEINPNPSRREMDMLLTTGEQTSVSLMAMAMDSLGVPAVSLNAFQVAMHTTSVYSNARIKRIDTDRIMNELEQRKIVIVTGFQGVDQFDNYTTLGRGGSDTTAVALAAALHADACEIYTDVDGVYTADPRKVSEAKN